MNEQQLPPLPEPAIANGPGSMFRFNYYNADQMRAYARAALAMSPKPVSGTSEQQEREAFKDMPNPSQTDLDDPLFEAIWQVIKSWDVNVPAHYAGYCGANGSHVMLILSQLRAALAANVPADLTPLAKRRIYDAIRGAYDLGCVDQQNGTRASREVELDHGNALISGLAAIAYLAAPSCTCPSGDGSLRWPCPEHPAPAPEATPLFKPNANEILKGYNLGFAAGKDAAAQAQQSIPKGIVLEVGRCPSLEPCDCDQSSGCKAGQITHVIRAAAKPEAQQPKGLTAEQRVLWGIGASGEGKQ